MGSLFGATETLNKINMDKIKIDNVTFFNLRKLEDAKREVGADAPVKDIITAYEKRAGLYTVEEPEKKTVAKKAVAKKTTRAKAKK